MPGRPTMRMVVGQGPIALAVGARGVVWTFLLSYILSRLFLPLSGAPVAQWVKRWPTDLAVPSSIPARGKIFSTINGAPLHTAFHYQPLIVLI